MQYPDIIQLRDVLSQYYNVSDLGNMCFDMGIDYDDLGGRTKSDKIRSLISHMSNRNRLGELAAYVQETRPFIQLKMSDTPPKREGFTGSGRLSESPKQEIHIHGNVSGGSFGTGNVSSTNYNQQGQTVNGPQINTAGDANIGQVGDNINTSGGDYVAGDKNIHEGDTVKGDKMSGNKATGNTYSNTGKMVGSVMGDGSVKAENIAGGDINIGAEPQTKEEFNQQLQELKTLLEQAIASGEIPASDAEAVQEDISGAIKEAAKETPSTRRLTGKLEYVQEVLDKAAGVATAAGKVGAAVLKAAPVLTGLIKVAGILF